MNKKLLFTMSFLTVSSYVFAADVNFDINMQTKQGDTSTNISIGNKPKPAPTTVIMKEKTVIIKENAGKSDVEHGNKKGHETKHKKHNKHYKHDKEDNERQDNNHERHHID